MQYKKSKDKIIITDLTQFNPKHILECGQVFRFKKINDDYIVYSLDKKAVISKIIENNKLVAYQIQTKDVDYFEEYFALKQDYNLIKNNVLNLINSDFMKDAIDFGYGIRILKQNYLEATISFVISQNNNIKRIQLIIENLCKNFGANMGDFYAFPTLRQLNKVTEKDFKKMGAGYRASYLVETIKWLNNFDYNNFINLSFDNQQKQILSVKGIGQKVADCIMLFGYYNMQVFPVDTWIDKVYREYFCKDKDEKLDRIKIRNSLVDIFKNYSGYAQQYLFYYRRSK